MLKAFDLPGYSVLESDKSEEDLESDNEDDTYSDSTDTDYFQFLPERMSCFAHTLQLVVQDGLMHCNQSTNAVAKVAAIHELHANL